MRSSVHHGPCLFRQERGEIVREMDRKRQKRELEVYENAGKGWKCMKMQVSAGKGAGSV